MTDYLEGIVTRYTDASRRFADVLNHVESDQWSWPTPCTEWDVRKLANHMTRGNLNYVALANGASADDFLRAREIDSLGADPLSAYLHSVEDVAATFADPNVLDRELDYPLGRLSGGRGLAVRATDTVIHTWDLARAISTPEELDEHSVDWILENTRAIFDGLAESPVDEHTTNRFFAPRPSSTDDRSATPQHRLLRIMGRTP